MTKTIKTINITGAVLLIINMGFELHDRIKAYCQNKKQEKQTDYFTYSQSDKARAIKSLLLEYVQRKYKLNDNGNQD